MKTLIKKDPKKGRGVFAAEAFEKGELIEACHLILLKHDDVSDGIEGYVYEYSSSKAAIALGNGSLFNHSDDCNCDFCFDYRKKLLVVEALRDIGPGEELTINYRYSASDRKRFGISG